MIDLLSDDSSNCNSDIGCDVDSIHQRAQRINGASDTESGKDSEDESEIAQTQKAESKRKEQRSRSQTSPYGSSQDADRGEKGREIANAKGYKNL
jgi:hypothetical protein